MFILSDVSVCPKFSQAQSEGDGAGGESNTGTRGGGAGGEKECGKNARKVKIQTSCSTKQVKNTCPE